MLSGCYLDVDRIDLLWYGWGKRQANPPKRYLKMGRSKKELDVGRMIEMIDQGVSIPQIATELEVSAPTLRARINELQDEQGLILQYRNVRNLHLTQLQARCLEAITPEKIADADIRDLIMAFKVLHDAETETKEGGKISGLVAYLLTIEKEEIACRTGEKDITPGKILEMNEDLPIIDTSVEIKDAQEELELQNLLARLEGRNEPVSN